LVDKVQLRKAYEHLQGKFSQDEMVQVIENYLDQKNLNELQALMLALFEERAKQLRHYLFDLMGSK
jgi:hypothetical protein